MLKESEQDSWLLFADDVLACLDEITAGLP